MIRPAAFVTLILSGLGPQGDATDASVPAALRTVQDSAALLSDREAAVKDLARTRAGGMALLRLEEEGRLPEELRATARFALAASPDAEVRAAADRRLPVPKSKDGTPLPPIAALAAMKGDPAAGARVYRRAEGPNCIACHQLGDEGRMVGPPLTTIGAKLSREQLFEAILTPSAAILMGYENWVIRTTGGDVKTGLKVEETDDHVTLKDAQGEFIDIPVERIAEKKMLRLSMMPEDLTKTMTLQELVDLVEYLTQQR
ncbi:MAG: c-type cytochrome [Planctomycetota bacterium]